MYFSLDVLSHIFKYLDDYSVFRFCQTNKFAMNLRRKEKLWSLIWNDRYPHNNIITELTLYQNFKRLVLIRKFIEIDLDSDLFYKRIVEHSKTPKREPDRAMFIPMWKYKGKDSEEKKLAETLRYAFGSVNIRLPEIHGEFDEPIMMANWLLSSGNLFLQPKPGDILAFRELDITENLYIFDGIEIKSSWSAYGFPHPHLSLLHWPEVALNYYRGRAVVPATVKEELDKNIIRKTIPINIEQCIRKDIYSFCQMNGRLFYAFYDMEFSNVGNYTFHDIWRRNTLSRYNQKFGETNYMLTCVYSQNGIEYIIFDKPKFL